MKANKLSPLSCSLVALAAVPCVVIVAIFLAALLIVLALIYWPVAPVAVYLGAKRYRQVYAKGPANPEDPGFIPHDRDAVATEAHA